MKTDYNINEAQRREIIDLSGLLQYEDTSYARILCDTTLKISVIEINVQFL
jgi:hypothetical protein